MSAAGQSRRVGVRSQRLRAPRSVRSTRTYTQHGLTLSVDDMWARLLVAIKQIQSHNISQLSYEEHYRYAYNLILNQQGDMLYTGVRKQVAEHLAHQVAEQLVPLFPLDAASARRAQDACDVARAPGNDASLAAVLGVLPDSPETPAILASIPAGERFLGALTSVWEDHCACMGKLRDVLKYVPIWDMGLDVFRDTVVRSERVPMLSNLLVTLLRHVFCERQGASVERRTLKSVADMLLSLTQPAAPGVPDMARRTVYEAAFVPLFLASTAEYYRAESVRLLAAQDATYYLEQAERRLNDEAARVTACLSSATLPALRATLERHLLSDPLEAVVGMPNGGVVALLESDRRAELERMYRLVQLVPTGLGVMNKAMRAYATERGRAINDAAHAAPSAERAMAWVDDVLAFKTRFDEVLATSFHHDKACEAAINEAFDSFINMNPRAPEFISLYIDEHLKRGAKAISDAEMDAVLHKTITVFRFVHEKDLFERYYKLHLTRRLLHGRSVSDDAERGMIAKLKVECGHGYVQKLQGMLNDMKLSQETLAAFQNALTREQRTLPFAMNVNVLTAIYWPVSAPATPVVWPEVLHEACAAFEAYYHTRHRGRVLTWQPQLGSAEVRVRFAARTHELVVSTYALLVLLQFADVPDDTALSYTDLQQRTQIGDTDLQRTLQSLACAKYKVLRKEPRGRDVLSTDLFYFNTAFTCPLARIKIAQVAAKVETPTERKETTAKVEEERKNQVDACIVRVMKSRKTLAHNELVNEVVRQLLPRFQPTPALIKKRIEALLEREFLEVPRVPPERARPDARAAPAKPDGVRAFSALPTATVADATPAAPSAPETDGREAMGTAASEADDFLARAQALGLRLTRADYERTRAGVTAFLKAERLPAASPGVGEAPDDERRTRPEARADTPGSASVDERIPPRAADVGPSSGASTAPVSSAPASTSTAALSRWLRTTSGQLSFFTAVVQPMSGHGDETRTRVTLDEVGSAEERRRRRARRRRLLEKQMLLDRQRTPREASPAAPADSASQRGASHSPARTIRAGSAPSEPATPTRPPPSDALMRTSTPVSHDTPAAPPSTSSPPMSPEINVLNRMARVDSGGKLWLERRSSDAKPKSEDSTAAVHDDSGVFCEQETSDSSSMLGWGPRAFGRTASGATEHLNASMKSMSLLDRIMMSKSSPRRMRREAKARSHWALDTDDDEENAADGAPLRRAPAAEVGGDVSSTSHWADVSADSTTSGAEDELPAAMASPVRGALRAGGTRWPPAVSTPPRVGAEAAAAVEQYDFVIEDISPDKPVAPAESPVRAHATPGASATPLTKLDVSAQITPMRYSPNYGMGYSHGRSTSITSMFSPNILTPWSHQGRLMSNAGLTNITSSPNLSGEWLSTSTMLNVPGSASRNNLIYTSTPLSHALGDESCAHAPNASPNRLLYIESFPGKSPQQARSVLANDSPTKPLRAHAAAPLTPLTHRAPRGATRESPRAHTPGTASAARLDLAQRIAPMYDVPAPMSTAWDKMPFRRTDTIRPADLFHPAATSAWTLASDTSPADTDEETSAGSAARRNSDDKAHTSRARATRRQAPMQRSASAVAAMTPMHGDDVFAHSTPSGDAPPAASALHDVFSEPLTSTDTHRTEWDRPDGSRVVKLVSEELQAAIDSGTLQTEPKPRFFRLPPGHGSSKAKPASVSYAGLIGQAILSSSDGRLSLAEIYQWISSMYPYYERGDRGWQNSIRHNLSLNKSFVKLERESSIPGKGGWWAILPGHESRFQNGMYQPNAARTDASATQPAARTFKPSHSAPAHALRSPMREGGKKRNGALQASPEPSDESMSDVSFKRPKTARTSRASIHTPMRLDAPQNSSSGTGHTHLPVLTDATSSPATSPLQSLSHDTYLQVPSVPRTWRTELGTYAPGAADLSPQKSTGLAPPPSATAYTRSVPDMPEFPTNPLYFHPDPPRAFPPSFSPSRRAPMHLMPMSQAPMPGMHTYPHTAYVACTYPPAPDAAFLPWPDSHGGDAGFHPGAASPSRLGWPHAS
ncbi:hypothetical protein MBRA1_001899 [Malassezia brasiliensis]|uniref:Cullin family profile domain-containing protein n=1 Tax=Malassezia brasiliensis TaxID=1821822 RepID=A0AAF0INS7_9BASI|nr:hypothetical protein MBRA1_001899 [Malassezia brasiliensis]